MINQRVLIVITVGFLVVALAGCDFLNMEAVPSPEAIEHWAGEFLIEADQIEGVYENLDVNSVIYTYKTGIRTRPDFEKALLSALQATKWRRSTNVTEYLEFHRSYWPGENSEDRPIILRFYRVAVARHAFNPESRTVIVALAETDTIKRNATFESTTPGKWAKKKFWPRFDALRKGQPPDTVGPGKG